MKKYLLILAMFGFVLYGCDTTPDEVENDDDNPTQTTPPDSETEEPQFAITGDGAFAIPFGGGEFEVAVETNLEYTVAIPENAKSWVSVKATRTLRTETVVFAVEANADNEERSTSVTFIDENGQTLQTITVKQEAKPEEKEPNEPDDPNDPEEPENPQFGVTGEVMFAIPAEGGEFEVAVETNLEYTVSIPEDAQPWINLKETRALRTETLVFEVAANDGSEERSTAIAFIGEDGKTLQTIAIKQEAAPEADEPDEPEEEGIPLNEIHYTTTDGNIVEPYRYDFGNGVNLISNTYENGVGILKFDNPVTGVGYEAFLCCSSLTSITIPDNVTAIGNWAFDSCTSLTSITLPEGVTAIGDSAFSFCTALTSITLPEGVTAIGDSAFGYCESLTSITIPEGVTEIGYSAFGYCKSLTSITIPESVTEIGYSAFSGCISFTSITIPESVTTIGNWAFSNCSSLTSITIPEGVTGIGNHAFYDCSSLTSITIPESVTEIGTNPFCDCESLSEFRGKYASDDGRCLIVDGVLKAFAPAGLTEYTIPYGVTEIGESAFAYYSSFTIITLPDGVTAIRDSAFAHCYSLESVIIPNSVTEIEQVAFYRCSSLESVIIPNSVTEIEQLAFYNCSSLTSITIPESVTEVGYSAFNDCTSLESVYCKALTPPGLDRNVFLSNASNRKIYVPYQSYYEYVWWSDWIYYAPEIVAYDFENNVVVDGFSGEKVELTANQLSSPFTHYSDGRGLEGLIDGDTSTHWHSVYNNYTPGDETYGYYIDIALDEPLNHFYFQYCTRTINNNAVPALVTIGGSHDGIEWTVLATDLTCYARDRGQWAVIEAVGSASAEAYEYLRFGVTESAGSAGGNLKGETNYNCVAMSELQLYKLTE